MNDDQLNDLKQFFSSQLSQTEQRLSARIGGVEERLDNIEAKVDTVIETMGDQLVDHEQRITKLETA